MFFLVIRSHVVELARNLIKIIPDDLPDLSRQPGALKNGPETQECDFLEQVKNMCLNIKPLLIF